jgi:hypothetical protein
LQMYHCVNMQQKTITLTANSGANDKLLLHSGVHLTPRQAVDLVLSL